MDRLLLAPEPLIRAILVALCDNERLQARSLLYLDRLEKSQVTQTSTGTTRPENSSGSHPQLTSTIPLGKRKAPEPPPPQICIQCKLAFLSNSNNPQACAFHHGAMEIEPSHRVWWSQDAQHALQNNNTEETREDRPEGFNWSCCGRGGAGPGCTEGEHLAIRADDRSKRRRVDPAADPDSLRLFEGKVLRPNEFVNNNLLESSSSDDSEWSEAVERGDAIPVGNDGGELPSEATERSSGGGSGGSYIGG